MGQKYLIRTNEEELMYQQINNKLKRDRRIKND